MKDSLNKIAYQSLLSEINRLNQQGLVSLIDQQLVLSLKGKLLADMVCEKLFII